MVDWLVKLFLTEDRVNKYVDTAVEAAEIVFSDKAKMNSYYKRLAILGLDCIKFCITKLNL